MEKYGMGDGKNPDLRRHREEFDDWTLDVLVGNDNIEVLCCPEDRRCDRPGCMEGRAMCSECRVLVCRFCLACVRDDKPNLPPGALANDMMILLRTPGNILRKNDCDGNDLCLSLHYFYGMLFAGSEIWQYVSHECAYE